MFCDSVNLFSFSKATPQDWTDSPEFYFEGATVSYVASSWLHGSVHYLPAHGLKAILHPKFISSPKQSLIDDFKNSFKASLHPEKFVFSLSS